jgi:glycosyltransferase involved in cell wall biosynthesis
VRIVLTRREPLDSRDGVNMFIVSLAEALSDLGHDVRIVVGSLQSHSEYRRLLAPRLDLPILALSRRPVRGIALAVAWLRAKWAIDRFKPDLVIHSEAVPVPFRGTIVQVAHDLEPRTGRLAPIRRAIRRFSTKRSDYVVATTRELRDALVGDLGMPADQIAIIPKCLDVHAYRGVDLGARERAILHSGTLPYKNPEATIRAFGALDDPSIRLYVVGDVTRPTQDAVAALPERIRKCVALLGAVDGHTVRNLYGRIRVAAFPTRYAVPVASATVMEAIAAKTPIVGASHLSRDVLSDGVNGLVVETHPSAMAAALRAALNDDALWSRLSAGAGRLGERFEASRVARQYIELVTANRARQHGSKCSREVPNPAVKPHVPFSLGRKRPR